MALEVDPDKLWRTAYVHMPNTATDFASAAYKMVHGKGRSEMSPRVEAAQPFRHPVNPG